MGSALLHEITPSMQAGGGRNIDTVRALCHDLRQPLAAILMLAASEGGDVRRKLDGILDQAQWLSQMVNEVLGEAAKDANECLDVAALAQACADRARPTAACEISFAAGPGALAMAQPVALSRAIGCIIDNAVRAAGPGGHVDVQVRRERGDVTVTVSDDGPGLGHVESRTSLGLTITRALVAACDGDFGLSSGRVHGAVARIALPAMRRQAVAS